MASETPGSPTETGDGIDDLQRRLGRLEESEPKTPLWKSTAGIAIITALIATAAPVTALVSGIYKLRIDQQEQQEHRRFAEIEAIRTLQKSYVEKATTYTDEAQLYRMLRFLKRQNDKALSDWATAEMRILDIRTRERADADRAERERSLALEKAERARILLRKERTDEAKAMLAEAELAQQVAEQTLTAAATQATTAQTLRLSTLRCVNAQTTGGGIDVIGVVVDGRTVWRGETCGKKDASVGTAKIPLDQEFEIFDRCIQIGLFEVDNIENDDLGVHTLCVGDTGSSLTFKGNLGFGLYHYEIDYEVKAARSTDGV